MTTENLKRFNHYDFSDIGINEAIVFLNTGVVPVHMNPRQAAAFQTKYGPNSGFISRVVHGHAELFYNPNPNYDLEIVRPGNTQARIQLIYGNPRLAGLGLSSFYKSICLHFLNIKKAQTDEFLKKQGDYQVTRETHRKPNIGITSSVCQERWYVDLIIMTPYDTPATNHGRMAIFMALDGFSGRVFARAILNRSNNPAMPTLSNAFDNIIQNEGQGGYPRIVHCDSEFNQGSFRAYCNLHHIVIAQSTSYSPWVNRVERANRELRRRLKRGLAANNNIIWIAHLQDYVAGINNAIGSRSHVSPNMLWTPGYHPHIAPHVAPAHIPLTDGMTLPQRQQYMERYQITRAQRMIAVGHDHIYNVGDLVRLSLYKFSNTMRAAKENKIGYNKVGIHFSPIICHVVNVVPPPANFTRRTGYNIADAAGHVIMAGVVPKMFFSSEMMPVPVPWVQTHINPLTVARCVYLNRL